MQIGELVRRCDVSIDTIRYYERQGLLAAPDRFASGYRRYQVADIERLRFARRAKVLGFTLDENREFLALSDHRDDEIGELKATASTKLIDIDARLAELTRIRDGVHTLIEACPGHRALERCPSSTP